MSFEDHIKKHKKELELKSVNPDIWHSIEGKLISPGKKKSLKNYLFAGAVIVILLLGLAYLFFQNKHQNDLLKETQNEVIALRSTMNQLLNESSSFSRIKAVNLSQNLEGADPEVIRALLFTVQNDPSKNVRLAALKAVEKFANETMVKRTLIEELKHSEEPFIQIRIINILSEVKEKKALPLLDQLIESEGTLKYVKEEAEMAKSQIQSI